jgi:hypothetical protein
MFSFSVDSVSMSLDMRGAKKLRVITALVVSLPAADFGADIVDFLGSARCHYRYASGVSLLPGNCYRGPLIPMRFWSLLYIFLPAPSPSVNSMLACICRRER